MQASTSAPAGQSCAGASCRALRYRSAPSAPGCQRAASYAAFSSVAFQYGKRGRGELEALACLAPAGIEPREQRPEATRMVHLHEVRDLVRNHVVGKRRGDMDEPP